MNGKIVVSDLTVTYVGHPVLERATFVAGLGKMIGIIGPNGAGKSTLLKSILGLIKSSSGEVLIAGKPVGEMREKIAYVKQKNDHDLTFPISVKDVVMLGMFPNLGLFKRPKKEHRALVHAALEKVGMEKFSTKQIGELSGGQLQRVFLARVLAQDADVIFLDEPFTGVDAKSEQQIMKVLREQRAMGKTIFMVHHDLSKVVDYFDELVIVNKEIVAFGDVADTFTEEHIDKAFHGSYVKAARSVQVESGQVSSL